MFNYQRTQVTNTLPSYEKAREALDLAVDNGTVIDYGAGKGLSRLVMPNISLFEPYPAEGFYPTYQESSEIPSDFYTALVCLNVLNVLEPNKRDHALSEIHRVLAVGGYAVISVRHKRAVDNIKNTKPGPGGGVITSLNTYQKGFDKVELSEYVHTKPGLVVISHLPQISGVAVLVKKVK